MNEPTDEQVKEFWEWCGCCQSKMQIDTGWWFYPDGEIHHGLPGIDLNNLFRYAVPQLPFLRMDYQPITEEYFFETMKPNTINLAVGRDKDPALALFWAIKETL